MLEGTLRECARNVLGIYTTHPKNKQPHVSRHQGRCLDVKCLDVKASQQVNRCAREQVCRGGGGRRRRESRWIAIHIPPYKKYISDIRPASVISLYLMVGKIQLWVHYLAIPYGMENPVVGQCTKKPQWSAEAFGG